MTPEEREQFTEELIRGATRTEAAEIIGMDVREVRLELRKDSEWAKEVLDIEKNNIEEAMYQAAISGNVSACIKWLEMKTESIQGTLPEGKSLPKEPPSFLNAEEEKQWFLLQRARMRLKKQKPY